MQYLPSLLSVPLSMSQYSTRFSMEVHQREWVPSARPSVMLLYACHQVFHWSMTCYARFFLKTSRKLQSFHYWMAGVNIFFVLLHLALSHWTHGSIFSAAHHYNNYGVYYPTYDTEVNLLILWGLSYWILLAKSGQRGIFFGLSVPFTKPIVLVANELLDFVFSWAVLYTYWRHPLKEISTLIIELIFVAHSCLIRTTFHKNKYWTMFVEMVLLFFFFHVLGPNRPKDTFFGSLNFCMVVFVVTQIHGLNLRLLVKIDIISVCILCIGFLCEHIIALANNDIHFMDTNDGMCVMPLFHYIILLLAAGPFIFCHYLFTVARCLQSVCVYASLLLLSALFVIL